MVEMREKNPRLASEIEGRAKKWLAENGVEFPGSLTTGLLGESDEERARFEEYANDAACPALNLETGLCDVYEARPMTCRVFGPPVRVDAGGAGDVKALGHCEICFTEATEEEVQKCEMSVPHELEAEVLKELEGAENLGETLVVFALL
jgi:Fe-S-cluster containining protein